MRIVITGGSSGLGLAMATRFVADGHGVRVISRKPPSIEGVVHHAADLASAGEGAKALTEAMDALGGLDVLVNNAGVMKFENAHESTAETILEQLQLNLAAPMQLSALAVTRMLGQEAGGQILNVASVAGLKATPKLAVYSAAKAGLIAYTKSLAAEYAGRKIRVNVISPGAVQTGLTNRLMWAMIQKNVPLGKLQTAEEIASLAAWLISEDARHVTGSVFSLDGGMSL